MIGIIEIQYFDDDFGRWVTADGPLGNPEESRP